MKVLNLKNLKNLEELGIVLKGNFGIKAKRNPNGSIAFRYLRPPQLDNPKINTTGLVNEKRVEELSAITLRRTWTQIGLELGYDTNILNVLSGRSKNLGTKTALGSYTSANLKMAVNFYEQIIDRIS